jgi:hypothetical protein
MRFDGEQELLLSSIRHVLATAYDRLPNHPVRSTGRSIPACPFCSLLRLRQAPADAPRSGHRQVHRRPARLLPEQAEADIRRAPPNQAMPAMAPELPAKRLVTTFLAVIDGWLQRRPAPSAREAGGTCPAWAEPVLHTNCRA